MRARVAVRLKREVLDPQGEAIRKACAALGYPEVVEVRQGKLFDIRWEGTEEGARERLRELAAKLLSNPVIEDFEIESLGNDRTEGGER